MSRPQLNFGRDTPLPPKRPTKDDNEKFKCPQCLLAGSPQPWMCIRMDDHWYCIRGHKTPFANATPSSCKTQANLFAEPEPPVDLSDETISREMEMFP